MSYEIYAITTTDCNFEYNYNYNYNGRLILYAQKSISGYGSSKTKRFLFF